MLKKFFIAITIFVYLALSPVTVFADIQNNIFKATSAPPPQTCGSDFRNGINSNFISQIEYPKEILPNKEFTVNITFNDKLQDESAVYYTYVSNDAAAAPITSETAVGPGAKASNTINKPGRFSFTMTVKSTRSTLLNLYLAKSLGGQNRVRVCLGSIRLIDEDFANIRCSLQTPLEVQAGKEFPVKYDIQPKSPSGSLITIRPKLVYSLNTYKDNSGNIGQPAPFNWDHMSNNVTSRGSTSEESLQSDHGQVTIKTPSDISQIKNFRVYILVTKLLSVTTGRLPVANYDGFICGYTDIELKGPHETVSSGEQDSEERLPPGAEISGTAIGKGICTLDSGDRQGSFPENEKINFNMDNFIEEGKQACVILEDSSGKKLVVDKPSIGKTSTIDTQGQAHFEYNPFYVSSESKLTPGKYTAKFYVNCYTPESREVCQDKPVSIDITTTEEKLCTVPEGLQPKDPINFSAQKLAPNQLFHAYITNTSNDEIINETPISGTSSSTGNLSMRLLDITNPGSYGVSLNTVNPDGSEENACYAKFDIGQNRCFVESGLKSSSVIALKAVGVQSGKQYGAFVTKKGETSPLNKTPVNGSGDSSGRFQVNYPQSLENGDYTFSLNDGSKNFCFYEFNVGSSERDLNLEDTYAKYDTKCAGSNCVKSAGIPCDPETGQEGQGGVKTAIGCFPTNPAGVIKAGVKIGVSAGGGIALLMMVFAAFRMITSAGNPETIKKGQEQFTSAVIGLLFIIFSVLLLEIIGVDILNLPGFNR